MNKEDKERRKNHFDIRIIKWLLTFAYPYKTLLVVSLVFMLIIAGLEVLIPYLTKVAVDNYIYPTWREVTFSDKPKDKIFEKKLNEEYPSYFIPINVDSYLINLSKIKLEDKINLEKLYIFSENRYLVIDPTNINPTQRDRILEIVKNNADIFKSLGSNYFANYSSLNRLSNHEIGILRSQEISVVAKVAVLVILSLFCVFILSALSTYILSLSGQRLMHRIRVEVFSHILKLPQAFFDKNPVGRLTTRVTNDVNAITELYTSVIIQSIKDSLVIIGIFAVMFIMNRELTLIILCLIILILIVSVLFRIRFKKVYSNVRQTIAKVNAFVQESVGGMFTIKLYIREKENLERFKNVNEESYRANMDELITTARYSPITEFLGISGGAIILWYGSYSVLQLNLTIGAFIAYLYYILMIFNPIFRMTERYNRLFSAIAASENLYGLMNLEPEGKETGRRIENFHGTIEFKNVWFSYNDSDWVLKNVSFRVNRGETVALVGLTGSGKSTIVNLILRFYDIQKGQILIDGIDIREYSPEFIREKISAVFQDTFLHEQILSGGSTNSLAELITYPYAERYFEPNRDFNSSGEKQLVSLVNAFSRVFNILILDESTSNLDAQTESTVKDKIKNFSMNKTTLIISHRPTSFRDVDRIIVIHQGEIIEVGNHDELLAKNGFYYNLYKLQDAIQQIQS